jgi:uncharacterized protein YcnI
VSPCSGHVGTLLKNIPIGSSALNYLKVPHGCGGWPGAAHYDTIGIELTLSTSFTSVTIGEVPHFTGNKKVNPDGTTTLIWSLDSNDHYSINGDGQHFQLFPYFSTLIAATPDGSTVRLGALQQCSNETYTNWNDVSNSPAEIKGVGSAPSIVGFKPQASTNAGQLNLYGNALFNTPASSIVSMAQAANMNMNMNMDSSDSTPKMLAIAAIVIGSVAVLISLFTLLTRKTSEQEHKEWMETRLKGMTSA